MVRILSVLIGAIGNPTPDGNDGLGVDAILGLGSRDVRSRRRSRVRRGLSCLLALGLLAACQTADGAFPGLGGTNSAASADSGDATAPATATADTASVMAGDAVDPLAPGRLHLIVSPAGAGSYYFPWYAQILMAERTPGLRPMMVGPVYEGQSQRVDLWPDRYRVRIFQDDVLKRDEWVEISADRPTIYYVDIGFFSNSVDLYDATESARAEAETAPIRILGVHQAFEPLRIDLGAGLTGLYEGPRHQGMPAGEGRMRVMHGDYEVAVIDPATVIDGRPIGMPVPTDGRRVDGAIGADGSVVEGTRTKWADGRTFEGRYHGLTPDEGLMWWPDGTAWEGAYDGDGFPVGPGLLTREDGVTILEAPGIDTGGFDGAYSCTLPNGTPDTCFYVEGTAVATKEEFDARMADRRVAEQEAQREAEETARLAAAEETARQEAAAEAAAVEAAREAAARAEATAANGAVNGAPSDAMTPETVTAATTMTPVDGCTDVEGSFVADGGLSRLRFDGGGRGHFWQQTYGGTETYTFDVDFSYAGTRGGMRFDYGPAVYKDMAGNVMRETTIPSGDSECAYDGRVVTINGKDFARE
ncbi:hypothetical protein KAJ83_03205 [Marivibrio halodurans]|uniref:MORN repeat-containing protein n=3 Tax=Marivibrio halodurans TaxID=2039722 RepID=A0A8J7V1E3_9PROT|nr:hypothetical protein [Marivibrio halodurans]